MYSAGSPLEIYHRTLRARLRYDLVARGLDRWGWLGMAGDGWGRGWGRLGIQGIQGTSRCCNGK